MYFIIKIFYIFYIKFISKTFYNLYNLYLFNSYRIFFAFKLMFKNLEWFCWFTERFCGTACYKILFSLKQTIITVILVVTINTLIHIFTPLSLEVVIYQFWYQFSFFFKSILWLHFHTKYTAPVHKKAILMVYPMLHFLWVFAL